MSIDPLGAGNRWCGTPTQHEFFVNRRPSYCGFCGARAETTGLSSDVVSRIVCRRCGQATLGEAYRAGPTLLVLTLVFAGDELLLLRRGMPPYEGKWAPPGGFVEPNESLESAAIRETKEEVGVDLDKEQLLPHAIISLPALNQVYVAFQACLEKRCDLKPALPEALDAKWFSEVDYADADVWGASSGFDPVMIYQGVLRKRFVFYQKSDEFLRLNIIDGTGACISHKS